MHSPESQASPWCEGPCLLSYKVTDNQPPAYIPCHLMDAILAIAGAAILMDKPAQSVRVSLLHPTLWRWLPLSMSPKKQTHAPPVLAINLPSFLSSKAHPSHPYSLPSSSWENEVAQIWELRPLITASHCPSANCTLERDENTENRETLRTSQCWFP